MLEIDGIYLQGGHDRTAKENQLAFKLLDYAGCAGSSDAYYFKATLYTNGIGTPVDLDKVSNDNLKLMLGLSGENE